MKSTETKLQYEICDESRQGIPVIIVAAGSSSRMQGIDKQLLMLSGIPVIVRTLKKFQNSPVISRIIVVTREDLIPEFQLLCKKYMISKLTDIVSGGDNRNASVMCGINRLAEDEKYVLIHDGARPFVSADMIEECATALVEYDGALCALEVNDTVKLANDDKTVVATLDRSRLYMAQTPQGVKVDVYKKAVEEANDPSVFTDDASVLEEAGLKVKLVSGSVMNIKITRPNDIELAEAILKGEC